MIVNFFARLLILVSCSLYVVSGIQANETTFAAYDGTQALKSIWLSAAAYCGKDSYKSHVFKGPTSGFVVTDIIYDRSTDTQGERCLKLHSLCRF